MPVSDLAVFSDLKNPNLRSSALLVFELDRWLDSHSQRNYFLAKIAHFRMVLVVLKTKFMHKNLKRNIHIYINVSQEKPISGEASDIKLNNKLRLGMRKRSLGQSRARINTRGLVAEKGPPTGKQPA